MKVKNDKNLIDYGNCHFCEKQMTWYDVNSSCGGISSDNKQICQACSNAFIKAYSKHSLNNESEADIRMNNYTSREIRKYLGDVTCPNCNAKINNRDSRYCDQCGYELNPPELVVDITWSKIFSAWLIGFLIMILGGKMSIEISMSVGLVFLVIGILLFYRKIFGKYLIEVNDNLLLIANTKIKI